jgi:hypothetical protein
MSIIDAMFGKKINKMTADNLKDHLFDVNGMLSSTRRKIDRLEQEMDKKLEDALNIQGTMIEVFAQEISAIESDIEFQNLIFSMYQQEKLNVKEIIQLKDAEARMSEVGLLSGDPRMRGLMKTVMDNRKMMKDKIRELQKTRDQLQRGRVSNSNSTESDNPQMEKFVNLINQMQNAKAKGLDTEASASMHEIRQTAKQMYGSRLFEE